MLGAVAAVIANEFLGGDGLTDTLKSAIESLKTALGSPSLDPREESY